MKELVTPLIGAVLLAQIALGQDAPSTPSTPTNPTPAGFTESARAKAQRFDLNFPGGGPKDLVAAIEKATGGTLNAIVPDEEASVKLPAVRVVNVTIAQLFNALKVASMKLERDPNTPRYSPHSCGFVPATPDAGDTVWVFRSEGPLPVTSCRFFQLAGYLQDYKLDDIITAIQTGWEMAGVGAKPALKFHPETKLLIAVGPDEQLQTIDSVLKELRNSPLKPATAASGPTQAPSKTDGETDKR